ncbi:hypothetical protein [Zobellia uliginosa]|uniref:hypothetical protein n=1 Tax=Zobellia uliginosa TaxID=143224 RepID=UPI0026E2F527|nr:hypothetical protein [Zobellia uliginosa]MDO6517799.1 hypothetical protein [Zobellia uliginosa]
MPGYVYLIIEEPFENEESGPWTKIGYSKNPPEWRMNANLKRGNPRNLIVFEVFVYETQTEAKNIFCTFNLRIITLKYIILKMVTTLNI